MGAPSDTHEARRLTLDALAVLAGFEEAVPFPRFRPDVYRRRPPDGAWFIGEAKATERPNDPHAIDRFDRYVEVCREYRSTVLFVLSVPVAEASCWQAFLVSALDVDASVRAGALSQSALLWCWHSPADGHTSRRGHSGHLDLSGRHNSRPC